MIRYFGLYSTHGLNSDPVAKAFLKGNIHWLYDASQHKARLYHCHWRGAMKRIFHVDPLICPCCHEEMIPVYSVFNGKTVYDPPKRRRRMEDIMNPRTFAYKEDLNV